MAQRPSRIDRRTTRTVLMTCATGRARYQVPRLHSCLQSATGPQQPRFLRIVDYRISEETMSAESQRQNPEMPAPRQRMFSVFLISVFGLFLELMLIRWIGT